MNSLQSLERPTYCRGKPTNIPCTKMSWCKQDQLEEGVRLLELAQRAPSLFQKQELSEKRRLLNSCFELLLEERELAKLLH